MTKREEILSQIEFLTLFVFNASNEELDRVTFEENIDYEGPTVTTGRYKPIAHSFKIKLPIISKHDIKRD